jgi:hypothetical protein
MLHRQRGVAITFYAFDVLAIEGTNVGKRVDYAPVDSGGKGAAWGKGEL